MSWACPALPRSPPRSSLLRSFAHPRSPPPLSSPSLLLLLLSAPLLAARFLKAKRVEFSTLRSALFPNVLTQAQAQAKARGEAGADGEGKQLRRGQKKKLRRADANALKKTKSKFYGKPVMDWVPPESAPIESAQEWEETIADVKAQVAQYTTGGAKLRTWLRGHRNTLEKLREKLFARFG